MIHLLSSRLENWSFNRAVIWNWVMMMRNSATLHTDNKADCACSASKIENLSTQNADNE